MIPRPGRLAWLVGASLAGCLDPTAAPDGSPGSGGAEISPASVFLPVAGRVTITAQPDGPFTLRVGDTKVVRAEGSTLVGVAPGATRVEALLPAGKRSITVTVERATSPLGARIIDEGLSDTSLLGVWCADLLTIFAVGSGGVILVSHDAGSTWQRMNSGVQADLTAVWGLSATDVYAVGARGAVIHYDGIAWRRIQVPSVDALLGIWGLDADHIYAVGTNTAIRFDGLAWRLMPGAGNAELWSVWGTHPDTLFAAGQNGVILKWDGASWRAMSSPTQLLLLGLWGLSATEVYAAGIRGLLLRYDGAAWRPVKIPSQADFFAIAGTGGNNIMLAGNNGAVVNFNGTAWTLAPQAASYENFRDISFDPAGTARVVGWAGTVVERGRNGWRSLLGAPVLLASSLGSDGAVWTVGSGGVVLRWKGATVDRVPVPVRRDLYGVTTTADGLLIIVGDSGTAVSQSHGAWSLESPPTTVLIRSVWADRSDPDAVFAVGDKGTILQRRGGIWRPHQSPTTVFLRHVFGLSPRDVFAVGDSGVVLHYEGGGWTRMVTPTTERLRGIWGTGPTDLIAVGANGTVIRFDGRRWYRVALETDKELRAVIGTGPTDIYIVGQDGVMFRFDGAGLTALPVVTAPAYLLGLAEGPGGSLIAVGTNRTLLQLSR